MKRRFEFRLERVRRVRDLEERIARAERARAEGHARQAEDRRYEARSLLAESRESLATVLSGPFEAPLVLTSQGALDGLLAGLRRRSETARTARLQAERIARLHGERKSAARALEELRERARQRHAAEVEKADNAALDEVAQRVARARAGWDENASRSPTRAVDEPAPASDRQR